MHTRFNLLLLTLLFSFSLFAQSEYEIKIKVNGFNAPEAYLGYQFGDKQYLLDTTKVGENGYYTFRGTDSLHSGMYLFVMPPKNDIFQLVINEPHPKFTFETDTLDFVKHAKITASKENQLFYDYLNYLAGQRSKGGAVSGKLEQASEADKPALQEQLAKLGEEVKAYQMKLISENPNSMAALIIKSTFDINEPESFEGKDDKEVSYNRWMYYKKHWFDNMDLKDDRLIYTPVMNEKVKAYIKNMVVEHPDSISKAADFILGKMDPKSELFKFYLIQFLNDYAKSKIIGMDAVYVHLVNKYYKTGMAYWTDEEQLAKIIKNANTLEPILIGKTAPDIQLEKEDKSVVSLHDIKAEYTVLFFWDPDCGHCKKQMPQVKDFYEKFKGKGVEVLAVCTKVTKEVPKCWEYVKEKGIVKWINATDPYLRSRYKQLYDIRQTPQIFVLDKNKEIIFKRINGDQLIEVMEDIMKKAEEDSLTAD